VAQTYPATWPGAPQGAGPQGAGPAGPSLPGPGGVPGSGTVGGRRARGLWAVALAARRRISGSWLVWAILAFLVALPVGAFLLQAFSPRLFGQGSSWWTFSAISQALQGKAFVGLFNSIWVSVAVCALDIAIGGGVAWVCMRTNI
jgi:ABC-type glycerol-3-phosphate transport system permease component